MEQPDRINNASRARRTNPWLRNLIVAALTCAIGCGAYFGSAAIRTFYRRSLGPLPYCQIARNADSYHNTNILVRARIFFDETGAYVVEDCDPVEALAASIVIDNTGPLIGPAYVEKLLVRSDVERQLKTAEALIEGRFDAEASPGCWAPKFRIEATSIKLVSSITDYVPPQSDGEPPRRLKH
jgi:hypothetical protein